jgi:hypothetical protein
MSYDIYCYKPNSDRPDVNEASQIIQDDNDIWAKKPYNFDTKTAIEKALLDADKTLTGFDYANLAVKKKKSVDDVKKDFIKFELGTQDPEVILEIFDYHVAIIIRYTYQGEQAKTAFQKLKRYINVIRETAGYFVYDPQTGEAFDPATHNFDGLRKYLSVSEEFDKIIKGSPTTNKRPWWKF